MSLLTHTAHWATASADETLGFIIPYIASDDLFPAYSACRRWQLWMKIEIRRRFRRFYVNMNERSWEQRFRGQLAAVQGASNPLALIVSGCEDHAVATSVLAAPSLRLFTGTQLLSQLRYLEFNFDEPRGYSPPNNWTKSHLQILTHSLPVLQFLTIRGQHVPRTLFLNSRPTLSILHSAPRLTRLRCDASIPLSVIAPHTLSKLARLETLVPITADEFARLSTLTPWLQELHVVLEYGSTTKLPIFFPELSLLQGVSDALLLLLTSTPELAAPNLMAVTAGPTLLSRDVVDGFAHLYGGEMYSYGLSRTRILEVSTARANLRTLRAALPNVRVANMDQIEPGVLEHIIDLFPGSDRLLVDTSELEPADYSALLGQIRGTDFKMLRLRDCYPGGNKGPEDWDELKGYGLALATGPKPVTLFVGHVSPGYRGRMERKAQFEAPDFVPF
jgi:hypothetical protein